VRRMGVQDARVCRFEAVADQKSFFFRPKKMSGSAVIRVRLAYDQAGDFRARDRLPVTASLGER
jgi:hypothetical protein